MHGVNRRNFLSRAIVSVIALTTAPIKMVLQKRRPENPFDWTKHMDVTTVQWEVQDGVPISFKVMAIVLPQRGLLPEVFG